MAELNYTNAISRYWNFNELIAIAIVGQSNSANSDAIANAITPLVGTIFCKVFEISSRLIFVELFQLTQTAVSRRWCVQITWTTEQRATCTETWGKGSWKRPCMPPALTRQLSGSTTLAMLSSMASLWRHGLDRKIDNKDDRNTHSNLGLYVNQCWAFLFFERIFQREKVLFIKEFEIFFIYLNYCIEFNGYITVERKYKKN